MRKPEIFRAAISAVIVWILGVAAFGGSSLVSVMPDPETQANWLLVLALIPATALGTGFYYKKGFHTNGLVLGTYTFGVTILLDASITVPVFVIPLGGNHVTFFSDPVFWLIGLEYVGLIALYSQILRKVNPSRVPNNLGN